MPRYLHVKTKRAEAHNEQIAWELLLQDKNLPYSLISCCLVAIRTVVYRAITVIDSLLFNAKWEILQLFNMENKSHIDEMTMVSFFILDQHA